MDIPSENLNKFEIMDSWKGYGCGVLRKVSFFQVVSQIISRKVSNLKMKGLKAQILQFFRVKNVVCSRYMHIYIFWKLASTQPLPWCFCFPINLSLDRSFPLGLYSLPINSVLWPRAMLSCMRNPRPIADAPELTQYSRQQLSLFDIRNNMQYLGR